jgi:hypothetical protein
LDDLDTHQRIDAHRAGLRALWTVWSVEVRVFSGALGKAPQVGAFSCRGVAVNPGRGHCCVSHGAVRTGNSPRGNLVRARHRSSNTGGPALKFEQVRDGLTGLESQPVKTDPGAPVTGIAAELWPTETGSRLTIPEPAARPEGVEMIVVSVVRGLQHPVKVLEGPVTPYSELPAHATDADERGTEHLGGLADGECAVGGTMACGVAALRFRQRSSPSELRMCAA